MSDAARIATDPDWVPYWQRVMDEYHRIVKAAEDDEPPMPLEREIAAPDATE